MNLTRVARFRPLWKPISILLCLVSSASILMARDQLVVDPHAVPFTDASIGSCSVEFTVHDPAGAPVYYAKVKVHFSYGFMNVKKMDLEVWTNVDGKARFDGLSAKIKQPFQFEASQGDREGSAVYDPAESCKAQHTIVLSKIGDDTHKP